MSTDFVRIVEVGPRDGLQNEGKTISTPVKIEFVNMLSQAGLKEIEVTSFVSPKRVPQLADAVEVFGKIKKKSGIVYSALVPNVEGLERALSCGVTKIAVFTAASEVFNRKNINASIAESIDRFRPVVSMARGRGVYVRGYVSTAFWCPYEGAVRPEKVTEVVGRLLDLGVDEISIGDTIGKATPGAVRALLPEVFRLVNVNSVSMHFHDTYGMAIANAIVSWEEFGVTTFDSSAGGLGGCPFAPGASGNVATEDLVHALESCGAKTNVDLNKIAGALKLMAPNLDHPFASRLSRVLLA